jgi:hypothetical protein
VETAAIIILVSNIKHSVYECPIQKVVTVWPENLINIGSILYSDQYGFPPYLEANVGIVPFTMSCRNLLSTYFIFD